MVRPLGLLKFESLDLPADRCARGQTEQAAGRLPPALLHHLHRGLPVRRQPRLSRGQSVNMATTQSGYSTASLINNHAHWSIYGSKSNLSDHVRHPGLRGHLSGHQAGLAGEGEDGHLPKALLRHPFPVRL